MKVIFRKKDLPFLAKFAKRDAGPRDYWLLACKIWKEDGLTRQDSSRLLLLQQGAFMGDTWSMCELARAYYRSADRSQLPLALSWWFRAVRLGDPGAGRDVEGLPLLERIQGHVGGGSEYADIEMRCAMLTEWILTRLGRDSWEDLSFTEQMGRVQALIDAASVQLGVKPPVHYVSERLEVGGRAAGGLADLGAGRIGLVRSDFENYPRLIQVLFHELGHFVVWGMLSQHQPAQMRRFGVTEARVQAWKRRDMGIEVPVTEEDPDTLSYGVYTNWMILFGR